MKTITLAEAVDCLDRDRIPVKESERTAGNVPYYGANGQQGWIDRAIFNEDLVVVAEDGGHFGAPDRGVAYRISGPAWVNNHGHVLRARPGVETQYLFHVLRNFDFTPYISGSTRSKLTQGQMMKATIPLPPLDEQRRIAAILDHADGLRAKRRQVLAHLDTLTQSIFHDMFGDPATNPRQLDEAPLGSLALKFSDGPFGSNLKSSHYTQRGIPVVRLQNIGVGRYLDRDRSYVSEDHYASLSKHDCKPGDVLIGTMGDPNLRACILPESMPTALNKADCIQMRVDPAVATAEFSCWLLNMPGTLTRANSLVHGQTRARISMGRLRDLVLPVPPLSAQTAFSTRVLAIGDLRVRAEAALSESDQLFASLQSRAFRGEL